MRDEQGKTAADIAGYSGIRYDALARFNEAAGSGPTVLAKRSPGLQRTNSARSPFEVHLNLMANDMLVLPQEHDAKRTNCQANNRNQLRIASESFRRCSSTCKVSTTYKRNNRRR